MTEAGSRQSKKDDIMQLLRDLQTVLVEHAGGRDFAKLEREIHSDEMSNVVRSLSEGERFWQSLSKILVQPDSAIRRILFGTALLELRDGPPVSLLATDDSHCLIVRVSPTETLSSIHYEQSLDLSKNYLTTVIVDTDFKTFLFRHSRAGKPAADYFLQMDDEMAATEISLVGSLWASVFPKHRAVLTRTIAFSVPRSTKANLFGDQQGVVNILKNRLRRRTPYHREDRALERLSMAFEAKQQRFVPRPLRLMTLEDVRTKLAAGGDGRAPILLSQTIKGEHVLRRYVPPYSKILGFGDTATPALPSRPDDVVTYMPTQHGREFHRDFLLSFHDWSSEHNELYRAAFDLLHVLAIRRSGLFRLGFAQRVYTVLLPPAVLRVNGRADEAIFLVPCVILYQVPRRSTFRRTFTLSHIAIPISMQVTSGSEDNSLNVQFGPPRPTAVDMLHALRADLKAPIVHDELPPKSPSVCVEGPLAELIDFPQVPISVPEVLQHIAHFVLSHTLSLDSASSARGVAASMAFASSLESRLATILLQVDWHTPPGDCQPWEKWLTTGTDTSLRDNIYKLMFYDDFLEPQSGYTSRRGVDLQTMLVGNTLRTDMNGMTFFDPTDELKLIVYPRAREHYPNYSIVRWTAFSLYAESALCSLQGMIQRFYMDLNEQEDLQQIVETLEDMIESFAELYDLDIRLHLYRQEYEKLRQLLKVDRDYEFLVNKFTSVKEDASLREQRLFNKLLVAFTLSSASVAIIGTMAQISRWAEWTRGRFLTITVVVAFILTVGGYTLFDRARRFLSRGR